MTHAFPCLLVLHNKNLCFLPVRPLEVEILFSNQPLSADRQYEVECQAIGSRPPSVITWWMDGIALVAQPTKVSWFLSLPLPFIKLFYIGEAFSCYVKGEKRYTWIKYNRMLHNKKRFLTLHVKLHFMLYLSMKLLEYCWYLC